MPGVFVSITLIIAGLFFIGSSLANIIVFQQAKKYPSTDKDATSAETFQNMTYLNIAFIVIGVIIIIIGSFGLYSASKGGGKGGGIRKKI